MLAASVVFAAVVLVAWFPAGALLAQQRTITRASSMLTQLRRDDRALAIESKKLSTQAEIARIARQQFGMVPPGALAYQVLPPPGSTGRATDPNAGDLGNTAVVSPSASAELPPGSLAGSKPGAGRTEHNASNQPGLLTRLLHTLEFWR
jgi:cell division protein FtsB